MVKSKDVQAGCQTMPVDQTPIRHKGQIPSGHCRTSGPQG